MTIFDEIGGATAVLAAVDDFYQRVLADPELTGYFEGTNLKQLKSHQRSFIARNMADVHARLHIKPAHFDLVVAHLVDTLSALGVSATTIEAIGTRLAPLKTEIAPR
jgi:hemoglobin